MILCNGAKLVGSVPDGVGVVFQQDASFAWMTVWDNVAFGLRRRGAAGADMRRRVDQVLAFMGLASFARAYPAQLSGGMRQRVCIARTLVLEPSILLLDEPFAALDQQTRLLMGDELLRIWRETGATVVLITHALDEAAMLSDRIGIMSARPGRFIDVVATKWPRERDSRIVSDPRFGEITGRLWADSARGVAARDGIGTIETTLGRLSNHIQRQHLDCAAARAFGRLGVVLEEIALPQLLGGCLIRSGGEVIVIVAVARPQASIADPAFETGVAVERRDEARNFRMPVLARRSTEAIFDEKAFHLSVSCSWSA